MTVEIFCDGCFDCSVIKGKVCQAIADLNLAAEVFTNHEPEKHGSNVICEGNFRMLIDGLLVSARTNCSVRDLMLLLNTENQLQY